MSGRTAHLDFETFCELDVRQVGAHRYSEHPSCEVLILCYKLPGKKKKFWLPHRDGQALPDDLVAYVEADDGTLTAHNAAFEACVWQNVLVARHGAPRVATRRWRCTAARAAAAGMPRALANLGPALRLDITKDREGTRLINIFCKNRKPTKLNSATRIYPDDKPEEFASFVQYCGTDVDTEAAADAVLPDLSDYEWRVYRHTELMNQRGLPLDMDAVRAGYEVLQVLEKRVVAKVEALTGGIRPTQRDKMLAFFNSLGLEMEDTQAKTIKDLVLLRGDDLEPDTKALLLLRIEGGKASTKKLKKMLLVVCEDGRVRGAFLYHGAGTGRFAGRLIQPQNFTRGEYTPEQLDDLFRLIMLRDPEAIEIIYEWPIDALAQGMRGYIKAPPGKKFVVVDFAAIEARVLVWLAREMRVVKLYHENADLYRLLAVRLYHLKSPDEVTTPQRKFAKDLFLGCFTEDTKVLSGRGWVPITSITTTDLLWDGVEWVHSSGCVYRGEKEVIRLWDIEATPDHLILCGQKWYRLDEVTRNPQLQQSVLSTGRSLSERILSGLKAELGGTSADVPAELPQHQVSQASNVGELPAAISAQRLRRRRLSSPPVIVLSTILHRLASGMARTRLSAVAGLLVSSSGRMLVNALCVVKSTSTLVGSLIPQKPLAACLVVKHGVVSSVKTQSTSISTNDSITCTSAASQDTTPVTKASWSAIDGSTLDCLRRIARNLKGMFLGQTNWNSTDETTTETIHRRTVDSSRSKRTSRTADVYDLLECGPRSRFTILTDKGPMIVHNSGFQLGWAGFIMNCLKRGIVVTEEEAKLGIKTYRDDNPMVVQLWADVERCAVQAVLTSASGTNPVTLRNIAFFVDGIWFCIRLPSGRLLRYPYPEVQNTLRYRKPVKKLTFRSEIKGKWLREGTYGGKLVENIVQAIARDLMVSGCFGAEAKGYPVVGTVHDELITLVDEGFGSAEELIDVVRLKPQWATDCPVNAEGWSGNRYRK